MARNTGRGRVVWKNNANPKQDSVERLPAATQEVPLEQPELYEGRLITGALFALQKDLEVVKPMRGYKPPPYPYVQESWYNYQSAAQLGISVLSRGSLAIYSGTVRVEETSRAGLNIRSLRHAFIIGGLKYITLNLNNFLPVS
jgi:hypothetical protein